jgi:hypothetical protein
MTQTPTPTVARAKEAIAYCGRRAHLRRTRRIALTVGLILTAVNQGAVIAGGDATAVTWVRCTINFVVPFVVSNLGLLSGHRSDPPEGNLGP